MENKELLKKAVNSFEEYTPSQSEVLNLLIDVAVGNIANVKVPFIANKTGVKAPTIYFALKTFLKDGILTKDANRMNAFVLNEEKLDYIVQLYQNKQNIN